MKEFANAKHLFKYDNTINIGEKIWCYGYLYTKVAPQRYENDASVIEIDEFNPFKEPVRRFKKGIKKAAIRNQFGQILK